MSIDGVPPVPDSTDKAANGARMSRATRKASSAATFLAHHASGHDGQDGATKPLCHVSFRSPDGRVGNRDEQTHLLHWFPAKMFYRIPIDILDNVPPATGGQILDPFCGSGTVLVEARARGHETVGLDVNPLSCLVSKVKTTPLNGPVLRDQLRVILTDAKRKRGTPEDHVLPEYWFRAGPRRALYRLYTSISDANVPASHRRFFTASLTSIVRRCSLADPSIPPPVRLNHSRRKAAGRRYQGAYDDAQALDPAGVFDMFSARTTKNITRVSEQLDLDAPRSRIYRRSATNMPVADGSVDTVITSPPYCGAQKYARTFKLELSLIGHTPSDLASIDRETLGTERVSTKYPRSMVDLPPPHKELLDAIATKSRTRSAMLAAYLRGLDRFAAELRRVLAPSGNAFITFGTSMFVKTHAVDFADIFVSYATSHRLAEVARLIDPIPSRGMITKRHHASSVIPEETIVWLRHR